MINGGCCCDRDAFVWQNVICCVCFHTFFFLVIHGPYFGMERRIHCVASIGSEYVSPSGHDVSKCMSAGLPVSYMYRNTPRDSPQEVSKDSVFCIKVEK